MCPTLSIFCVHFIFHSQSIFPQHFRCTIDMHFKAFHYYTFAHTILTSKYEFWVTNYVEKWCTVTHLLHICGTKKSPLFDNFHRGGYINFSQFFIKFLVHFLDTTYKVPHFTRNNAAFWCRGFLRLCFENFNFLAVFGQGKGESIVPLHIHLSLLW